MRCGNHYQLLRCLQGRSLQRIGVCMKQIEFDFSRRGHRLSIVRKSLALGNLSIVESGRERRVRAVDAKAVLSVIADFDVCFMSVAKIAEAAELSERTVSRVIQALRNAMVLGVEKHDRRGGHFASNYYVVDYGALAIKSETVFPEPAKSKDSSENQQQPNTPKKDQEEWNQVRDYLDSVGVSQSGKAVSEAKRKGHCPRVVLQHLRALPSSTPGVYYNQTICPTTPKPNIVSLPRRVDPEIARNRAWVHLRGVYGRPPTEDEVMEFMGALVGSS